jgi:hypothetical protein
MLCPVTERLPLPPRIIFYAPGRDMSTQGVRKGDLVSYPGETGRELGLALGVKCSLEYEAVILAGSGLIHVPVTAVLLETLDCA